MSDEATDKDTNMWGMLCHLSGLAGLSSIPFASIIAPLIIWLIKREEHPYIDEQGKEALNFQISVAIYTIACIALVFVGIGFLLLPVLLVAWFALTIVGAVKAKDGDGYRYPLTIRLIK